MLCHCTAQSPCSHSLRVPIYGLPITDSFYKRTLHTLSLSLLFQLLPSLSIRKVSHGLHITNAKAYEGPIAAPLPPFGLNTSFSNPSSQSLLLLLLTEERWLFQCNCLGHTSKNLVLTSQSQQASKSVSNAFEVVPPLTGVTLLLVSWTILGFLLGPSGPPLLPLLLHF